MGGNAETVIGVVGPCGAGKSTLTEGLKRHGYRARAIVQEHSYVPSMWQRITHPDILIFLDASYQVTCQRRKLDWTEAEYAEQQRRLSHARQHADFYLDTDELNIEEVRQQVMGFLGHCHAEGVLPWHRPPPFVPRTTAARRCETAGKVCPKHPHNDAGDPSDAKNASSEPALPAPVPQAQVRAAKE